ncbi:hypothetical protein V502_10276 [Pseudogymnoascus sp. VKM F-4520 (FW-2644)]|nr:hypothetical protein V502_10276 [Pseudogymnoascus sp. VKM F-4520 (FW-2644)]
MGLVCKKRKIVSSSSSHGHFDPTTNACSIELYVANKESFRIAPTSRIPVPQPFDSGKCSEEACNIEEDLYDKHPAGSGVIDREAETRRSHDNEMRKAVNEMNVEAIRANIIALEMGEQRNNEKDDLIGGIFGRDFGNIRREARLKLLEEKGDLQFAISNANTIIQSPRTEQSNLKESLRNHHDGATRVQDLVLSDEETTKRAKIVHTGAKSTNVEDIVATSSASEIGNIAMKSDNAGGNAATLSTPESIHPVVQEDSLIPSVAEEESSSDSEVLQDILAEARKKLQEWKDR